VTRALRIAGEAWRPVLATGMLFAAAIALGLCLAGCPRSAQLQVLTGMTSAASAAVPSMLDARERQGEKCFAGTPTRAEASACLDAVRADWRPVWLALDVLEDADQAALDGDVQLEQVRGVYCGLALVLADRGIALPQEVCP
jgi:outer membrane murein-binding lipoprotein Lpp